MKKRIPTFLAGMLTMALVCGLSVSALAASGLIQLDVCPINVMVKGEQFKPKDANGEDVLVFTYQGTTYAPLRALAEAYGLEVGYDAATNMATVTGDVAAPGTPTTETPNTTAVPKLSKLTYEEFKGHLKIRLEGDKKLTAPSETGVFYHYFLTFGTDLNEDDFLSEWDAFINTNIASQYFSSLLSEYAAKAPYNIIVLHFEYNGKTLKEIVDW